MEYLLSTAFLAIFKRLRHRLRHQPTWTDPDRHNRLMSAQPAHVGTIPAPNGSDSKILFLYHHLRKYSISLNICLHLPGILRNSRDNTVKIRRNLLREKAGSRGFQSHGNAKSIF